MSGFRRDPDVLMRHARWLCAAGDELAAIPISETAVAPGAAAESYDLVRAQLLAAHARFAAELAEAGASLRAAVAEHTCADDDLANRGE